MTQLFVEGQGEGQGAEKGLPTEDDGKKRKEWKKSKRGKKLTKETAKEKLGEWYGKVAVQQSHLHIYQKAALFLSI